MQLIADSGATKTSWRLVDHAGVVLKMSTIGYNPHYFTTEKIIESLADTLLPQLEVQTTEISEIHFYGAGCSTPNISKIVEDAFIPLFPNAKVWVEHDLLGAARALCGRSAGVACILGTGSNTCLYDGKNVIDNVTSLGFLLGDEGSGAELGRRLVRAYFYREMPPDLHTIFYEQYQLDKETLYYNVYKSGVPSRYMASFSRFIGANINHPFIHQLVKNAFEVFTDAHVMKYANVQQLPINFVGSVAFHYRHILQAVLAARGLQLGIIIKEPIETLIKFHQGV